MSTGQKRDTQSNPGTLTGSAQPLLSLCMIVRDEEELLPRFLEQVKGLWDELCVVDTGSQDRTQEILRAAGARIIERPWQGDFAEARNAGLNEARGTWILFLDADEMVSPALVTQIQALVREPAAGAATMCMSNELPHGHRREARLLRLFRNHPSIRFRHAIHEEITSTVTAYLRDSALQLRHLGGVVQHLGYVRERAEASNKKERDLQLLRAAIDRDGRDFYSWFKLLELARFWRDEDLARTEATRCLAALEAAGRDALAGQPYGGELLALVAAGAFVEGGEGDERALELLDAWQPQLVSSAAFWLRRGELCELLGRTAEAGESFARCFDLVGETADVQLATVRPLMGLARLSLGAPGGIERAWELTEKALTFNPRDPEALLSAVTICRTAGGPTLVEEFTTSHRGRHGDSDELRAALGEYDPIPLLSPRAL